MANTTPEVSVVIPCYNCADTVASSIASAQQQDYDDFEIVVVDDGSSDESAEIAAGTGVNVLVQPHKGPGAAINAGVERASGRYIAFLDADDLWTDNSLQMRMELLHNIPELGLVCSNLEMRQAESGAFIGNFLDGRDELAQMERQSVGADAYVVRWGAVRQLLRRTFISTISVIVPKRVFQEVGGFDESLWVGECTDLWLRIASRYPVAYTTRVGAIYCKRSESNIGNAELATEGLLKLWLKFSRLYAKQYPDLHELFATHVGSHAYEAGLTAMKRGDRAAAREHFATCIRNMPSWKSAWINCLLTYLPPSRPNRRGNPS